MDQQGPHQNNNWTRPRKQAMTIQGRAKTIIIIIISYPILLLLLLLSLLLFIII